MPLRAARVFEMRTARCNPLSIRDSQRVRFIPVRFGSLHGPAVLVAACSQPAEYGILPCSAHGRSLVLPAAQRSALGPGMVEACGLGAHRGRSASLVRRPYLQKVLADSVAVLGRLARTEQFGAARIGSGAEDRRDGDAGHTASAQEAKQYAASSAPAGAEHGVLLRSRKRHDVLLANAPASRHAAAAPLGKRNYLKIMLL